jgi:hypothetical protein
MNIAMMIYKNDEALDPDALLGHIALTNGSSTIKAENTYIDSWIHALIQGLRTIRSESHCVVDLIDEPDPLVFDVSDGDILLSYGNATLNAGSIENFTITLKSAASLLLDLVREEAKEITNQMLEDIQIFVSRG